MRQERTWFCGIVGVEFRDEAADDGHLEDKDEGVHERLRGLVSLSFCREACKSARVLCPKEGVVRCELRADMGFRW